MHEICTDDVDSDLYDMTFMRWIEESAVTCLIHPWLPKDVGCDERGSVRLVLGKVIMYFLLSYYPQEYVCHHG